MCAVLRLVGFSVVCQAFFPPYGQVLFPFFGVYEKTSVQCGPHPRSPLSIPSKLFKGPFTSIGFSLSIRAVWPVGGFRVLSISIDFFAFFIFFGLRSFFPFCR